MELVGLALEKRVHESALVGVDTARRHAEHTLRCDGRRLGPCILPGRPEGRLEVRPAPEAEVEAVRAVRIHEAYGTIEEDEITDLVDREDYAE